MSTYRESGVDIGAGDRAVDLMRASIARTGGPEVVGGLGGFAGLFDASRLTTMRRPLLATSTDGVGTKVLIASRLGIYDTVGIDLVGMVVDDLVVCGAEPLFMTDYMVFGALRPERAAAILAERPPRNDRDYDVEAVLPTLKAKALIIHSMDDESCPVGNSQRMAELWPGSELMLLDGLGHRLIAQDDDVVARITEFVEGFG